MQVFFIYFIFILFKISQNNVKKINFYTKISQISKNQIFFLTFDNLLHLCYFLLI